MRIEMYTAPACAYCRRAKDLLIRSRLQYTEIDIARYPAKATEMVQRSGRRTVPQIFIDGVPVGGYEELSRIDLPQGLDA